MQGNVISNGSIKDSVIVAGKKKKIRCDDGYIMDSIAVAGEIESRSIRTSLVSIEPSSESSRRSGMRNSGLIDQRRVYKHLENPKNKK